MPSRDRQFATGMPWYSTPSMASDFRRLVAAMRRRSTLASGAAEGCQNALMRGGRISVVRPGVKAGGMKLLVARGELLSVPFAPMTFARRCRLSSDRMLRSRKIGRLKIRERSNVFEVGYLDDLQTPSKPRARNSP